MIMTITHKMMTQADMEARLDDVVASACLGVATAPDLLAREMACHHDAHHADMDDARFCVMSDQLDEYVAEHLEAIQSSDAEARSAHPHNHQLEPGDPNEVRLVFLGKRSLPDDLTPKAEPRQLANAFSYRLRQLIDSQRLDDPQAVQRTMADINRLNAARDDGTCASHDFCDPNVAMLQAFRDTVGRSWLAASEADANLINDAWAMAKAAGFSPMKEGATQ